MWTQMTTVNRINITKKLKTKYMLHPISQWCLANGCTIPKTIKNKRVNSIIKWLQENNFNMNLDKIKLMNFTLRKAAVTTNEEYKGTHTDGPDITNYKCLGKVIYRKMIRQAYHYSAAAIL